MKNIIEGLVGGWGINDADYQVQKYLKVADNKWKRIWVCPIYADWKAMIERCHRINVTGDFPTYIGCTVCEEWKYFSNFRNWVLNVQPNKDWENCTLDKDLLFNGNKVYSPETTVYVNKSLNSFLVNRTKNRGDLLLGVSLCHDSKIRPYRAECSNPFNGKRDYMGLFLTEIEAHKAWQAKKHEHALRLAEEQNDPRVTKALRERYAPDKDWIKV